MTIVLDTQMCIALAIFASVAVWAWRERDGAGDDL